MIVDCYNTNASNAAHAKQVVEDYGRYLYLQRLREPEVILAAISNEVVRHLLSELGSEVEATIEVQAKVPQRVPDNVVRTVTENCRTLKFDSNGFEKD
ncbi:MAG: hypothetical protein HYR88_18520 [Verrucomicrobia bacterium]|nr:hypothetical protein [Verrucomicrobiota bacterium]MBI3868699.1 hypothetical protein [Verrucomicrobiota bacterium]